MILFNCAGADNRTFKKGCACGPHPHTKINCALEAYCWLVLFQDFSTESGDLSTFTCFNHLEAHFVSEILFFSNNPNTTIWVNWFGLPFLQTKITQAQKETFITLSDHEPVISTINLKKWKWFYLIFWQKFFLDIVIIIYYIRYQILFYFNRTSIPMWNKSTINYYFHMSKFRISFS